MPAYVHDVPLVASEAMTQFYAVKIGSSAMTADLNDAQGERLIGIVQEEISTADATKGRVADVRVSGISRAVASAAITVGSVVTGTNDGRVMTADTGDFPLGVALTAADAAGDQLDILLQPGAVGVA